MQVQKEVEIAPLLWYKLGGKVKFLLTCKSKEDILEALEFIVQNNVNNVFTIGEGSNLIFAKNYFDGAIIQIVGTGKSFELKEEVVSSFAGETLDNLVKFCFGNNLIGLEWAGGLPGTVGAGVRGNVGAFGGEIKDTFKYAKVARFKKGRIETLKLENEDMNFSYRESKIKHDKNLFILEASFYLKKATDDELQEAKVIYEKNINYRKEKHPIEYPNCGSIFKNIVKKDQTEKVFEVWPDVKEKAISQWYGKVSMGYIINRLGFTGNKVGGAQISEKHSNFIVNTGDATGADVLTLISEIKEAMQKKFGITPEVEPEIII